MNLILIIVLLIVIYFVLGRIFHLPTPADELHFAETDDGWHISMYRYIPAEPVRGREPVILCHGLSSNRYNLDFDEDKSIARYLREQGFDSWVMDLRGRGHSRAKGGWKKPWGWCFDDYMRSDIPAALNLVKGYTGMTRVHWVGHSMGGMLMYAYLGSVEQASIQSFCAIGSPAKFDYFWFPVPLRRAARVLLNIIPVFFDRIMARFASPLPFLVNTRRFGYDRRVLPRFLANAVANVSSNVLKQFLDWIETGGFFSEDRKVNYQENLGKITRPFLLVAGRMDWASPPKMCRFTFEKIASTDKQLIVCGKENGYRQDYDHLSLIVGLHAREEVFPRIRDFLIQHSSA